MRRPLEDSNDASRGGYPRSVAASDPSVVPRRDSLTRLRRLLWVVVLVPCLALGLVMLVFEGLTFKKLGTIAEEERERAAMGERI